MMAVDVTVAAASKAFNITGSDQACVGVVGATGVSDILHSMHNKYNKFTRVPTVSLVEAEFKGLLRTA